MPFSFFLALPAIPRFSKKEIDEGIVSTEAAALCEAIRAAFFLSRSIRKERDLWLHFTADRALIVLHGQSLRYLGPDERSMLMLVDKARAVILHGTGGLVESTPGITCATGIDLGGALAVLIKSQGLIPLIAPRFDVQNQPGGPAMQFLPSLPGIPASQAACVLLGPACSPAPAWSELLVAPEQLITTMVIVNRSIASHASKIMVFNMIEDNAVVGGT
jgi:hypothetical protein